jgi:hypothetical protein
MDVKFWKALAALGVPGVALGLFYRLYDKFDWPLKSLPPDLVFILILVFMALIAAVVILTLFLWRPRPEVKSTSTAVSINVPKGCTFQIAAKAIASDRLIDFEGFTAKELSSPLNPRSVSASSPEHLIAQLRQIASRQIRPYTVTIAASGSYLAKVI